jgi:hypothetical protein
METVGVAGIEVFDRIESLMSGISHDLNCPGVGTFDCVAANSEPSTPPLAPPLPPPPLARCEEVQTKGDGASSASFPDRAVPTELSPPRSMRSTVRAVLREVRGESNGVGLSGLKRKEEGNPEFRGLSMKAVDVSKFEVLKRDTDIGSTGSSLFSRCCS